MRHFLSAERIFIMSNIHFYAPFFFNQIHIVARIRVVVACFLLIYIYRGSQGLKLLLPMTNITAASSKCYFFIPVNYRNTHRQNDAPDLLRFHFATCNAQMPISFRNAVPDCITLTKSQRQSFIHTADAIVAETLQANEHFVARGRKWPLEQWKYVKTKEQMHVYRSRNPERTMTAFNIMNDEILPSRPRFLSLSAMERAPPGLPYVHEYEAVTPRLYEKDSTNTHSTSSSNHSSFSREINDVVAQSKPPFVVATGVLDGTVDDVAYGAMASTVHAWTVRSAYVQDTTLYDDRKVLATLQGPRAEDPFRSVTIKWATTSYGAWTTRRDFVYIESTGMAFDADGERVFYSLLHSIEVEACAPVYERKDLIRAYISTCYLARQFDGPRVEMFCRGVIDPRGDMLERYGIHVLAKTLTRCARYVECAYLKKLHDLMSSTGVATLSRRHDCDVCLQPFAKRCVLLPRVECASCQRIICTKCAVQKKLVIETTSGMARQNLNFCLLCVLKAKKLSAWEVATGLWRR